MTKLWTNYIDHESNSAPAQNESQASVIYVCFSYKWKNIYLHTSQDAENTGH